MINGLEQTQAIALGALRPGLPDHVEIVTKKRLTELNGKTPPNIVARTSGHIEYIEKQPTFALIDVDTKGMPETVAARIAALGGYWPALVSVMPQLATAAHIVWNSTSSGLSRSDPSLTPVSILSFQFNQLDMRKLSLALLSRDFD
jgi:hypothetical protein